MESSDYRTTADVPGASHVRARAMASPVEGKANATPDDLLAEQPVLVKSSGRPVAGATARYEIVEIDGLTNDELRSRLYRLSVGARSQTEGL